MMTSTLRRKIINTPERLVNRSGTMFMRIIEGFSYVEILKIIKERQAVLNDAFAKHPERFKGKMPKPLVLSAAIWINKPLPEISDQLRH